jgi:hypothetical protein
MVLKIQFIYMYRMKIAWCSGVFLVDHFHHNITLWIPDRGVLVLHKLPLHLVITPSILSLQRNARKHYHVRALFEIRKWTA